MVGMLNTMLRASEAMSATCVSTRGSEARCDVVFTVFIVDPLRGCRDCTEYTFVVELLLTQ